MITTDWFPVSYPNAVDFLYSCSIISIYVASLAFHLFDLTISIDWLTDYSCNSSLQWLTDEYWLEKLLTDKPSYRWCLLADQICVSQ